MHMQEETVNMLLESSWFYGWNDFHFVMLEFGLCLSLAGMQVIKTIKYKPIIKRERNLHIIND